MRFDRLGGFLCYYGVSGWEAFTWVAVGIEGKICFNSLELALHGICTTQGRRSVG
jgi:hypothetical protein